MTTSGRNPVADQERNQSHQARHDSVQAAKFPFINQQKKKKQKID